MQAQRYPIIARESNRNEIILTFEWNVKEAMIPSAQCILFE